MSYYTKVQLYFDGPDYFASFSEEKILPHLLEKARGFRAIRHPDGFDELYLDSLEQAFAGTVLDMKGYGSILEEFLKYLSKELPGVVFGGRGLGEEFDDVWVVYYKNGERFSPLLPPPRPTVISDAERAATNTWFTRSTSSRGGWRSFVRPVYVKILAFILLTATIIIISRVV